MGAPEHGAGIAVRLQQKARGERPVYFDEPAIDTVLSITLALAGEVAVLRDRLDAIERLAEVGSAPTRQAIEAFVPDAGVRAERDAWREHFLDVVLRAVHQQKEDLERRAAQGAYDEAVRAVEDPDGAARMPATVRPQAADPR